MSRSPKQAGPQTLQEYQSEVDRLEQLVDVLIEKGDYEQADVENKKMERYKKEMHELETQDAKNRQKAKEEELEEAFKKVQSELNLKWDEAQVSFERECETQINELRVYFSILIYNIIFFLFVHFYIGST